MQADNKPAGRADKLLFTPGPLSTSRTVKQAMLRDLGSRDAEFMAAVREVRTRLLEVANAPADEYTTVIMQGAGTFGLEAVVSSCMPPTGKLLVLINGAYGRRVVKIAQMLGIPVETLEYAECETPDPAALGAALAADPEVFMVAACHCETTTGIINPVAELGAVCKHHGRQFFLDAMSSFGAVPLSVPECHIDYLVSSANKCIEGVPGFAFAICRTAALSASRGWARSLSLDLCDQNDVLEKTGQFRFTPPVQSLLAYRQALIELEAEGGASGRAARYRENYDLLLAGMRELGFREYLAPEVQGHIITTFHSPDDARWDFARFYQLLSADGFIIYPGKLGEADVFRIGTIGRIFPADIRALLDGIRRALNTLGIEVPLGGNHGS
jgi:2-aminoethylphosphonate-pyruvate transaminase